MDETIKSIIDNGKPSQDWFKRWLWLDGVGWVEQYKNDGRVFVNLFGGTQRRLTGPLASAAICRMP